MRQFTRASSHFIELARSAPNIEFDTSVTTAHATTIRFRTSDTSARGIIYSAGRGTTGQTHCYIDMNGVTPGEFRVIVYETSGTFVSWTRPATADGNFHTVTVVRVNATTWRVFFDGAQLGADRTITTTVASVVTRMIGKMWVGTAFYFQGDVGMVAYHDGMSLADHSALSAGTKHVFQLATTCKGFVPCGPSTAQENDDIKTYYDLSTPGVTVFPSVHRAGTLPPLAASPVDRPWAMSSVDVNFGSAEILAMRTGIAVARGGGGASDNFIREVGNVFPRPGGGYGLMYAGAVADDPGASTSLVQVHLATSPDLTNGGTWTKQGIVLPQATLGYYTEDPYVITYGGLLYCFVEKRSGASQLDIVLLSSSDDGLTWTQLADPILANSTDSSFDTNDTSSPVVIQLGARLYMLYEGRSSGDNGKIGLAWSDDGPAGPWTKYNLGTNQADPIIDRVPGTWYANSLVPDDIVKVGGTFYLFAHGTDGTGYVMGAFKTTDPTLQTGWTQAFTDRITDTEVNTIMLASDADGAAGLVMVGVNETSAQSTYKNIMRYEGFGTAAPLIRKIRVGSSVVEDLNVGPDPVGAVYLGTDLLYSA